MASALTTLVTGGTGFVGSFLVEKLLTECPDEDVLLLVRDPNRVLGNPLLSDLKIRHGHRLGMLQGDIIDSSDFGIKEQKELSRARERVTKIWHSAASVSFKESQRADTFRVNLDGTRHVIRFAESCPQLKRFFYIGTCYTSGFNETIRYEDEHQRPLRFKDPYGESKYESEAEVRQSNLPWTVLKLSIVLGHSRTGQTVSGNAYYGILNSLYSIIRLYAREQSRPMQGIEVSPPLRLRGRASRKNHLCVDHMIDIMWRIAASDKSTTKAYHIAHSQMSDMGAVLDGMTKALDCKGIIWDPDLTEPSMTSIERLANKLIRDYQPYFLDDDPVFDMANTRGIIGDDYPFHEHGVEKLQELFRAFLVQKNRPD